MSEKALALIDRQFHVQIVDPITLQLIKLIKNPFGPDGVFTDKEYGSVSFDSQENLLLAVQFRPNELKVLTFECSSRELDLQETIQFPEPSYFLKVTPAENRWILRSATGNVYCMDNLDSKNWLLMTPNVSKVFDVLDDEKTTMRQNSDGEQDRKFYTSFGVKLLADFKLTSFYRNLMGKGENDKFLQRYEKKLDLSAVLDENSSETFGTSDETSTPVQNSMIFEPNCEKSILLAQKTRNRELKLSKLTIINENDDLINFQLEYSKILPFVLQESIEDLMVCGENQSIYLATRKAVQISRQPPEKGVWERTMKMITDRVRPKSVTN